MNGVNWPISLVPILELSRVPASRSFPNIPRASGSAFMRSFRTETLESRNQLEDHQPWAIDCQNSPPGISSGILCAPLDIITFSGASGVIGCSRVWPERLPPECTYKLALVYSVFYSILG